MSTDQPSFSDRIELIESAYEYMLAYAAQGRESDEDLKGGPPVREVLANLSGALHGLSDSVTDIEQGNAVRDFCETLATDAVHARRAVEMVNGRQRISSQLIDNLNATIHLRSVLTNLFLIDEALKCQEIQPA